MRAIQLWSNCVCIFSFWRVFQLAQVVESEADELVAKYGTPRRTAIVTDGPRRSSFALLTNMPVAADCRSE